jgi:hypothetical protein
MMMKIVVAPLVFVVVLCGSRIAAASPSFRDTAKHAHAVFVGRLVAVGKAPGFWAGDAVGFQTLTYEVTDVLRGTEKRTRVALRFMIVASAPYVGSQADVAARLVTIGDSYIVAESGHSPWGILADDAAPADVATIAAIRHR